MKNRKIIVLLMCFQLLFIIGCENQSAINQENASRIVELTNEKELLQKKLDEVNELNASLMLKNEELIRNDEDLIPKEHEIIYDLRIPISVFEVVHKHFLAIQEDDIDLLKETIKDNTGLSDRVYQLLEIGKTTKIELKALNYQHENTYENGSKVTKSIVVGVKYNDNNVSFALQNTNDQGWMIVDID